MGQEWKRFHLHCLWYENANPCPHRGYQGKRGEVDNAEVELGWRTWCDEQTNKQTSGGVGARWWQTACWCRRRSRTCEQRWLWTATTLTWERGDGVRGLFAMSELLWIVGETHGYPLKHSVERDCENDEKASKSCLGGGWGFETKLPTSNPESPVPAWGIAWEWPWPDSSMMFPSTTPFSGFSCLEAALQRLIRMCVT